MIKGFLAIRKATRVTSKAVEVRNDPSESGSGGSSVATG